MTGNQLIGGAQDALQAFNGIQRGGVAGGLQAATGASKLAQQMGISVPKDLKTGLGTANDAYSLYNAFAHPGVGTALSGVGGAADLYNKYQAATGGTGLSQGFGNTLGGIGDAAGIYNAFKNPTAGNVVSGALDAYKLYNMFAGAGSAAAGAGAAGAEAGGSALTEGGAAAGSGAAGAASYLGPIGWAAAGAIMAYEGYQQDKQNATPLAQMQILATNGPMEAQLANNMVSLASKYGDPKNPSSWNISNWSAADQKAVNYGKATDVLRSAGLGKNAIKGGHRYGDINANA